MGVGVGVGVGMSVGVVVSVVVRIVEGFSFSRVRIDRVATVAAHYWVQVVCRYYVCSM